MSNFPPGGPSFGGPFNYGGPYPPPFPPNVPFNNNMMPQPPFQNQRPPQFPSSIPQPPGQVLYGNVAAFQGNAQYPQSGFPVPPPPPPQYFSYGQYHNGMIAGHPYTPSTQGYGFSGLPPPPTQVPVSAPTPHVIPYNSSTSTPPKSSLIPQSAPLSNGVMAVSQEIGDKSVGAALPMVTQDTTEPRFFATTEKDSGATSPAEVSRLQSDASGVENRVSAGTNSGRNSRRDTSPMQIDSAISEQSKVESIYRFHGKQQTQSPRPSMFLSHFELKLLTRISDIYRSIL